MLFQSTVLLAGTGLGIVLLGVGIALGYRLGCCQAEAATSMIAVRPARVPPMPAAHECSLLILQKVQTLMVVAAENQQAMPSAIQEAIEDLADATKTLRLQMAGLAKQALQSLPVAASDAQTSGAGAKCSQRTHGEKPLPVDGKAGPASGSKLSGDEFQRLTAEAGQAFGYAHDVSKQRQRFEVVQTIYRWCETEDGQVIEAGTAVRCHDLGVHGISFLWPKSPDFERLIIALGPRENVTHMTAEVVNCKAVVMQKEACYLIGCKFTGRLPSFSDESRRRFNERQDARRELAAT